MAANGFSGHSDTLEWKLGLINSNKKYLTAETFGFKINASGQNLKKKQVWTLEHDRTAETVVYIRSHLGRYLSGDKRGNVTCDSEEKGAGEKFTLEYDAAGRWAFRNVQHGYYFGGVEDNLRCYEKEAGSTEWWTVHLAVHPQVNIRSVNRKRYAHLASEARQIRVDELIPWGQDALITLEFREGKYAVKTCDNFYLSRDGTLCRVPSEDTLFSLEIRSGQNAGMALKDRKGTYMTAVGTGAMQSKNKTISKDELFTLEDSHPQGCFYAHNGKKVSTKQGVDLTANQDELSDKETFQVEYDKPTDQWRIRTCDNKYWSLEAASGIQAVGNDKCPSGLFSFEWLDGGAMAIKASNGRYITARMNGSLYAVSDGVADRERFFFTIINRPLLVLRCEFGFVGQKTNSNPRLECNKATHDIMHLEHSDEPGSYYLKGSNGKYWSLSPDCMINADSDQKHPFIFELKGQSRMFIKAPNGRYVKGEQNGIFCAKSDLSKATQWEY